MPYDKLSDLPDAVKGLPKHAQEIFLAAYNAAFKEYDGNEGKAFATAWTAVKNKFKKSDSGEWVAKEAQANEKVIAKGVDVVEISCPKCGGDKFEPNGAMLECVKCKTLVERKKELPMLQAKYAEIIQEVARRDITSDASRIQDVLGLCGALLVAEPDEKMTEAAIKKANDALTWLKSQAPMKTEDGVKFPREAFAYAPSDNPSDWQLRLWESTERGATKDQLRKASAYLSEGGLSGKHVSVVKESLPAVKRRIREEYRKLDVPDEDIPRWVKEAESRTMLSSYVPLKEAEIGSKGIAHVVVIKPGFGNPVDNHYYPVETLRRDYAVFEGVKMYADHQTEEEEKQRPEGSIRQWVASLKNVRYQEGVGIVGDAVIVEPWLQAKLAMLRDKSLLSEMGISVRAAGIGSKGKVEGKEANVVERITRARSVDFVTEAGAGGGVLLYESNANEFDVDVISLGTLRERRPDLVKNIETEIKAKTLQEVKRMSELEEKIKEQGTALETLTKERDDLKGKIEAAEKAQRIAEAKSQVDEAVGKSDLPDAAKARILERFKGAEKAEGITEAIKAEKDYIAALTESGKVKGMGEKPAPETSKAALKESFKRLHPNWTDAQLDIAVR